MATRGAESERFRVILNKEDQTYFAGETIKGEVQFNLVKTCKIRGIKIQIVGKGKCKWMELLRRSSSNESTRSLFYSSKEIYITNESNLPEFQPRGLELSSGEHVIEFSMILDDNLPSSFKGNYGSIKYKMRVLIQRAWALNERRTIPFTVIKNMPISSIYIANPTSLEKQITKTISLFGTRPISMIAILPADFGLRGEPLRTCVTVVNNSTTNIEKLRFSVVQIINYYSHLPLRVQKVETLNIVTKETGSVHKKSQRSFAHELLLPKTLQPSDDEMSGVINISYELRVEAVLRGLFKNLVLNLPFRVYSGQSADSISMNSALPQLPPLPPMHPNLPMYTAHPVYTERQMSANPFETPDNSMANVYPSLDSSIGSPSHSSQYSESSSINSTTSESSAATLSPAVGVSGGGNASSSSSQFNSPAARSSLRNSNVPYISYSSSPLMMSSYPPSDSPMYSSMVLPPLPPAVMPTAPSRASANYSTSISMLLSSQGFRSHGSSHELPPSYEELFGSSPSELPLPQPTPKL